MKKKEKLVITMICTLILILATLMPTTREANCGSAPASSKKVTVVLATEPDTLDLPTSKMEPVSAPVAENITERLIAISPTGQYVPGLASSWKISPDGKEIEFTLRKGIKFHSGDPLTAKDIEFSHARSMKISATYQRASRFLENVEVMDDYRVKFKFKRPMPNSYRTAVLPLSPKPTMTRWERIGISNSRTEQDLTSSCAGNRGNTSRLRSMKPTGAACLR